MQVPTLNPKPEPSVEVACGVLAATMEVAFSSEKRVRDVKALGFRANYLSYNLNS